MCYFMMKFVLFFFLVSQVMISIVVFRLLFVLKDDDFVFNENIWCGLVGDIWKLDMVEIVFD